MRQAQRCLSILAVMSFAKLSIFASESATAAQNQPPTEPNNIEMETATVAVIDSGVDNDHISLSSQMWMNPKEIAENSKDDDRNAYIDDIFGWNFSERNPSIIDRSYLGKFSPIPYRYFELQEKQLLGTITNAELEWMRETIADAKNLKELQKFGNFVHGTHVAGIITGQSTASRIMALKIIPTEVKLPFLEFAREKGITFPIEDSALGTHELHQAKINSRDFILKSLLTLLAQAQGVIMADVGKYIHRQQAQVANGSFGVSSKSAEGILRPLLRIAFGRHATPEELSLYSDFFVGKVVQAQSVLTDASKQTLFVFAAGNDGADNDIHPTSPANIRRDNVVTVAATTGTQKLAVFSNFGSTMVDVAAPGTAIRSSSPGNEFVVMSGTSQAAPYVAGVASAIRAINPELTAGETRMILIKTVEKFEFLTGKVQSGGMVNKERALHAAELSLQMPVTLAIAEAQQAIPQGTMPRTQIPLQDTIAQSSQAGQKDISQAQQSPSQPEESAKLQLPFPSPFQ